MDQNCVFCDRSQFEERLIRENKSFYLIATLGQITDGGYVLLVPKVHAPCFAALPDTPLYSELAISRAVDDIVRALSAEYDSPPITLFEHGIVGQTVQHARWHFLPARINFADRIKTDFPTASTSTIDGQRGFREQHIKNGPYLVWADLKKSMLACWNPPAPPQYLRIVAAELLGRPERASWHNMDPELDRKLWSETVRRLKPYFS